MGKTPRPLLSFVLLELPPTKKESKHFVAVKDPEKDKRSWAKEGKVLAIGVNKNGFVFRSPEDAGIKPGFKVGDTVYYSSFTGNQLSNNLLFIKYKNILGVK